MSDFPFDDRAKLESEEDELPEIPEWPTILTPAQKTILDRKSSEK